MNNNPISLVSGLTQAAKDSLLNLAETGTILSSEEKINFRTQICSDCKCFSRETGRCQLCGCFMNMKIRLDSSRCPANKW